MTVHWPYCEISGFNSIHLTHVLDQGAHFDFSSVNIGSRDTVWFIQAVIRQRDKNAVQHGKHCFQCLYQTLYSQNREKTFFLKVKTGEKRSK